jgi:hypothetical protein
MDSRRDGETNGQTNMVTLMDGHHVQMDQARRQCVFISYISLWYVSDWGG